jgi:FKBP-type peptidyl-prolyl cis-trans isomerase SlyD
MPIIDSYARECLHEGASMTVTEGDVVTVEYTVRLADDRIIETTIDHAPLIYTHGRNEILRGLEAGLEGMELGTTKILMIPPSEAYGDIHSEGFFEVPKSRVPEAAQRRGVKLEVTAPDGRTVFPYVAEVKPEVIVLDLNHPLAGETLRFDVRVLEIQRGQKQTMAVPRGLTI